MTVWAESMVSKAMHTVTRASCFFIFFFTIASALVNHPTIKRYSCRHVSILSSVRVENGDDLSPTTTPTTPTTKTPTTSSSASAHNDATTDIMKHDSNFIVDVVSSLLITFLSSLILVVTVSIKLKDPEGFVCSLVPKPLANWLREQPSSWIAFNRCQWLLASPIALTSIDLIRYIWKQRDPSLDQSISDMSYGTHHLQTLDFFHHGIEKDSEASTQKKRPIVIFIHGGAWSQGSKELFSLVGQRLRDEGYIAVVPNYRRYPLGDCACQVNDIGAVVNWVTHNMSVSYGGDITRIILVGHSSGAHISSLYLVAGAGCDTHGCDRDHGNGNGNDAHAVSDGNGGHNMGLHNDNGENKTTGHLGDGTNFACNRRESNSNPNPNPNPKPNSNPNPNPYPNPNPNLNPNPLPTVSAFIGLSGVYNTASHYEYERSRGVHEISALYPAACSGGFGSAEANSPTTLVEALLVLGSSNRSGGSSSGGSSFKSSPSSPSRATPTPLPLRERLPPIWLFHADDDTTVPRSSSEAFYRALRACECRARFNHQLGYYKRTSEDRAVPVPAVYAPVRDDSVSIEEEEGEGEGDSEAKEKETVKGGHTGDLLDLIMGKEHTNCASLIRQALADIDSRA